jgi:peptidoglycan hydrolase CwlO-like protein
VGDNMENTNELLLAILNELKSINSKLDDINSNVDWVDRRSEESEKQLKEINSKVDTIIESLENKNS